MSSRAFCYSLKLLPVAATAALISIPAAAGPLPVSAEAALPRATPTHVVPVASNSNSYKITVQTKGGAINKTSSSVPTTTGKILPGTVVKTTRVPPGSMKARPK